MKIKLTEEQYRKFVSEDTNRSRFMDKVYKEIQNSELKHIFPLIVDTYGFSVDEVIEDEMLYHLIGYKLLDATNRYGYYGFNPRSYRRYMNAIADKLGDEVIHSNLTPDKKVIELSTILKLYDGNVGGDEIKEIRDGLVYDAIKYYFDNNTPKKAIQLSSLLSEKTRGWGFDGEMMSTIKHFAEQNGLKIFHKIAGLTFEKKDGMIQSLVNYINDTPPKSKEGFLQYINSRGRTSGQHSTFFRAAVASGIIKKVRNGRNITYALGPNYEAWKNGNLVAF